MTTFLLILGFIVAVWWIAGVIMMAFFVPVYVMPGTPLSVKLQTVFISGFIMPYLLITMGQLPAGSALMPKDATPEQEAMLRKHMQDNCRCRTCRARRGQ